MNDQNNILPLLQEKNEFRFKREVVPLLTGQNYGRKNVDDRSSLGDSLHVECYHPGSGCAAIFNKNLQNRNIVQMDDNGKIINLKHRITTGFWKDGIIDESRMPLTHEDLVYNTFNEMVEGYYQKYGMIYIDPSEFTNEELTYILALHMMMLKFTDVIDPKDAKVSFVPGNVNDTKYFFKSPSGLWQYYQLHEESDDKFCRAITSDSLDLLIDLELLSFATFSDLYDNFEEDWLRFDEMRNYYEKCKKLSFSEEFLQEYKDKVLLESYSLGYDYDVSIDKQNFIDTKIKKLINNG